MNMLLTEKSQTMSSTQLAELLGKEKKEVNRQIKQMFTDEIDGGEFAPSLDSRGYVSDYHLPETETHMFVAKYDATHLRKLAEYWVNRNQPKKLSELGMISIMAAEMDNQAKRLDAANVMAEVTRLGLVNLENKVNGINNNIVDKAKTAIRPSLGYASITTCQNHFADKFPKSHIRGIIDDKTTGPHIRFEHCTTYVPATNSMDSFPAYCLADLEYVIDGLIKSGVRVNKQDGKPSIKIKSKHYSQSFKYPV